VADGTTGVVAQIKIDQLRRGQWRAVSAAEGVRVRAAHVGHRVQDVARDQCFSHLPAWRACAKTMADDRLVPEERVLDASLPVIAERLLPPTASHSGDPSDRPIPSARPRRVSRHPGSLGRRNNDGRTSALSGIVEGDGVVGSVCRDPGHAALDSLEHFGTDPGVIDRGVRQRVRHDLTGLVDLSLPKIPNRFYPLHIAAQRATVSSMVALIVALCAGLRSSVVSRVDLAIEILALQHQLAVLQRDRSRPRLRRSDRLVWVLLSRVWPRWRGTLQLVTPDTVVRWHRHAFRVYWRCRSAPRRPGRPAISSDLCALIREMHAANPLWGAPRIHGELQKLGLAVAQSTVAKYLRTFGRAPSSQNWRTFLANHRSQLASVDFFTVPTATFRVLFVFVILAHDRGRIVHLNVAAHPTPAWTAQQFREAWPWEMAPRFVIRDRDTVYGTAVPHVLDAFGIEEVVTAPQCPWQNPFVERVIGTVRREGLDHVIVWNERSLRRYLQQYLVYDHGFRTHLSLEKDAPGLRAIDPPEHGHVVAIPHVGGLHHHYERRAA
jgi:putative transposase